MLDAGAKPPLLKLTKSSNTTIKEAAALAVNNLQVPVEEERKRFIETFSGVSPDGREAGKTKKFVMFSCNSNGNFSGSSTTTEKRENCKRTLSNRKVIRL